MKTFEELREFFENEGFIVYPFEQDNMKCAEIEKWTDGGVDMIITLMPFSEEKFIEYVNGFDVDEEIDLNRQGRQYRDAFTLSESLKDFKAFHESLKGTAEKLQGNNTSGQPRKTHGFTVYLSGDGTTPEEAWRDAIKGFDPEETPKSYTEGTMNQMQITFDQPVNILPFITGTNQNEIIGIKEWNIEPIYSLYCEFMTTGNYPYLKDVVNFIIEKLSLSLSVEQTDNLKSHVYMAGSKYRNEQDQKHREKMISEGWLLLNYEVVQKAINEKKRLVLSGKISLDWLSKNINEEVKYRPIIDGQGNYFLISPKKRNHGRFVQHLMKPYNDHDTFCKIV